MANREALRELQSRLAARLQSSQDEARTANWLAVEAGGQGFPLGLAHAGEIFPPALPESVREHARLVALNPALGAQCALLVERLAGLRLPDQLERTDTGPDDTARPAFAGPVWRDADGRAWQELDLSALARHEQFLGIAE